MELIDVCLILLLIVFTIVAADVVFFKQNTGGEINEQKGIDLCQKNNDTFVRMEARSSREFVPMIECNHTFISYNTEEVVWREN